LFYYITVTSWSDLRNRCDVHFKHIRCVCVSIDFSGQHQHVHRRVARD